MGNYHWPDIAGGYESPKEKALVEAVRTNVEAEAEARKVVAQAAATDAANIAALLNYLTVGPRIMEPPMISIGVGDPADVLMTYFLGYLAGGVPYKADPVEIDISGLAGPFTEVAAGKKVRCLLTVNVTDGSYDAVQGVDVDEAEDAVTPDAPEGTLGFGYVEVTTGVAVFTFGTTALTGIATFHNMITPLTLT